jgi:hypothetical protein
LLKRAAARFPEAGRVPTENREYRLQLMMVASIAIDYPHGLVHFHQRTSRR